MSSEFGKKLTVSIFGQSHGEAIGCVVNGFPAGEEIDFDKLSRFMDRRRGGKGAHSTLRAEADKPEFLSGVAEGKTCAFPLCAIIKNADKRSGDYSALQNTPRPGHADLTAYFKWGRNVDMRGGGHFSGRLTAPICVAGGIAKQILERKGVFIGAHVSQIAGVKDASFPVFPEKAMFDEISEKKIPVIDDQAGDEMLSEIEQARLSLDSVGGIVECAIIGVPEGLGNPMFDGVENRLAQAIFGIPAVKGVEFGAGFEAANLRGSQNNDAFFFDEKGRVRSETNHSGGILGGITTGMPITLRAAFKPTPSISGKQKTVNLETKENTEIEISGRHDPTVVIRAVPVVEAVCALTVLDMMLEENQ
ncbi:MAG: chorismate synthase [Clostridia bacterium]|nr:chorismate synthase [Clostridia bacterium]